MNILIAGKVYELEVKIMDEYGKVIEQTHMLTDSLESVANRLRSVADHVEVENKKALKKQVEDEK